MIRPRQVSRLTQGVESPAGQIGSSEPLTISSVEGAQVFESALLDLENPLGIAEQCSSDSDEIELPVVELFEQLVQRHRAGASACGVGSHEVAVDTHPSDGDRWLGGDLL